MGSELMFRSVRTFRTLWSAERLLAIGGDSVSSLASLNETLNRAGVIGDDQGRSWVAKRTVVVLTGRTRAAALKTALMAKSSTDDYLALLVRQDELAVQAEAAGGALIQLIGEHEVHYE